VIADTRAVLDKIAGAIAVLHEVEPAPRRIGIVGLAAIVPYGDARRLIDGLQPAQVDDATELLETLWAPLSAEDLVEVEAPTGSWPRRSRPSGQRCSPAARSARGSRAWQKKQSLREEDSTHPGESSLPPARAATASRSRASGR
jgi:hypothetical protein